jgi:hypothetical protein
VHDRQYSYSQDQAATYNEAGSQPYYLKSTNSDLQKHVFETPL